MDNLEDSGTLEASNIEEGSGVGQKKGMDVHFK